MGWGFWKRFLIVLVVLERTCLYVSQFLPVNPCKVEWPGESRAADVVVLGLFGL